MLTAIVTTIFILVLITTPGLIAEHFEKRKKAKAQ